MSLRLGLIQFKSSEEKEKNIDKALKYINEACLKGCEIVSLQELFNTGYFPNRGVDKNFFDLAEHVPGPTIDIMCNKAKENEIYLIAPIFEEHISGQFFNTAVIIDPSGKIIGTYRKTHIPRDMLSDEKYYFRPGNLGLQVFRTPKITIGILICADRHYPEAFRVLSLKGAELVIVPSAIDVPEMKDYWNVELRGAAVANTCFVGGINYVGNNFWGSSMIVDPIGTIIAQAGETDDEIVVADLDISLIRKTRVLRGWLRDRRPDLYGPIIDYLT